MLRQDGLLCPHPIDERPDRNSTNQPGNVPDAAALKSAYGPDTMLLANVVLPLTDSGYRSAAAPCLRSTRTQEVTPVGVMLFAMEFQCLSHCWRSHSVNGNIARG